MSDVMIWVIVVSVLDFSMQYTLFFLKNQIIEQTLSGLNKIMGKTKRTIALF
jgi:hypothetical protein